MEDARRMCDFQEIILNISDFTSGGKKMLVCDIELLLWWIAGFDMQMWESTDTPEAI